MIADRETLHLPFDASAHRLRVGLRPLASDAEWLEIDGNYARDLDWKATLLRERHDEVVAALPDTEEMGAELFQTVVDNLRTHHPGIVEHNADGSVTNLVTGERVRGDGTGRDGTGLHPVDAAARLVQDDFVLMSPTSAGAVLAAASLCFPSRWRLCDKIGLPMHLIHEPVTGYDVHLSKPTDGSMARLSADRIMWRLNWALHDDPTYFQPGSHTRHQNEAVEGVHADDVGEAIHLRVERQSLRRLPKTGVIVFGIRTHQWPMNVLAGKPDKCAHMAMHLRTVDDGFASYKSLHRLIPPVLQWLDRHSA